MSRSPRLILGLALALSVLATVTVSSANTASSEASSIPPSQIAPSALETRPLRIGQRAPDATVYSLDGKAVQLNAVLGRKQSVVVFFRGGWCPYCNKQLAQLQNSLTPLEQLGYQIIAVSPDTPDQLRGFKEEKKLGFEIYSDRDGQATAGFGLAYRAQPKDFGGEPMFKSWQAAGPPDRSKTPFLPVPAVYLVTKTKTIFYDYVNVNISVRLSAEVLLTAARVYGAKG